MALRFLADHCVSNFTVQNLRESNHEVLCLRTFCRSNQRMPSLLPTG